MTVKQVCAISLTGCIALIMMVLGGCAHTSKSMPTDTLISKSAKIKQLNTFVTAVNAAGLAETLESDGPYTVFAPVNKAFKNLGEEKLAELMNPENKARLSSILTFHVVPETIVSDDIQGVIRKTTVNGEDITLSVYKGRLMVENADIIKTDITCANGIIHLIDTVILPSSEKEITAHNEPVSEDKTSVQDEPVAEDEPEATDKPVADEEPVAQDEPAPNKEE